MALEIFSFEFIISISTGGFALVMSIYNFWKSRQGPRVVLGEFVEIGAMLAFSPQTRLEHLLLYLPINFFNDGSDTAMVTDVTIAVEGDEGVVPMYLMKRVKGRIAEEIESIKPEFPIFIEVGKGSVETFEFMDGPEAALKLDKAYQITITANYNFKRSVSKTYSVKLVKDEVTKFPKLKWIHLHRKEKEIPPPIIFGKDIRK